MEHTNLSRKIYFNKSCISSKQNIIHSSTKIDFSSFIRTILVISYSFLNSEYESGFKITPSRL